MSHSELFSESFIRVTDTEESSQLDLVTFSEQLHLDGNAIKKTPPYD